MDNNNTNKQRFNEQLCRGEIYLVDLSGGAVGSEQGGVRPVLIVQNDKGNRFSNTTIVVPITSRTTKTKIPTHVTIKRDASGLGRDSIVLAEQLRTIDKSRLQTKVGTLSEDIMNKIDMALWVSLGMTMSPTAC